MCRMRAIQLYRIVSYRWCFVSRLPYFFVEKEPCVQFKRVYLFCGCCCRRWRRHRRCRCCCCCCIFARDIRLCVAHSTLYSILLHSMCVSVHASHMNAWHTQWHKNFRAHTHIAHRTHTHTGIHTNMPSIVDFNACKHCLIAMFVSVWFVTILHQ